jgi:hypothetical protein
MLNQRRRKDSVGGLLNFFPQYISVYKYFPHHQDKALGRGFPGVREDVCITCGVVFELSKDRHT